MPRDAAETRSTSNFKAAFYRQARLWHGWLSALAFLALMFFAATGLLLNNEDWFKSRPATELQTVTFSADELASAKTAPDPNRALALTAARRLGLSGEIAAPRPGDRKAGGGERRTAEAGGLKLRNARGGAEIAVDAQHGNAQVTIERLDAISILKNLHKGKTAGPAWRVMIDVAAVLVLALSLVGYALFFALRFRLRTGLILTGATLAGAVAVFLFATP